MVATRVIDSHLELANIGTKTHAQIESHIQGIGNYAFPVADGTANQILETNGADVLSWCDKPGGFACASLNTCNLTDIGTRAHASLTGIGVSDHHTDHQAASAEDADFKSVNIATGESYKQNSAGILRKKSQSIFVGEYAGKANPSGDYNVFCGFKTGYYDSSGHSNAFFGYLAGFKNSSGYNNCFIGYKAGYKTLGGYYNVFIGSKTGYYNTSGHNNVFIGRRAGYSNTNGDANAFIGESAGEHNTSGKYGTFIGPFAGLNNASGDFNLFLGYDSGYANLIGDYNTFLGSYAGFSSIGDYNVCIGYEAGFNETGSNKLYIAKGSSDALTLIHGEFDNKYLFHKGADSAPADAKLHNSDINFWIDEVNDQLEIKVKKSNGVVITGNVQLV